MGSFSLFWKGLREFASVRHLELFPLRHQLKGYGWLDGVADCRAGLAVALLAVPQGMAYAMIAGLDVHYGILCSAVAAIVGPLLASSRITVLGPTNATAFMIFSTIGASMLAHKHALMPLLVLMVGLLLVFGALLRLADLVQYVSRSVVVGYLTGAAVLIMANQLQHFLGVAPLMEASQETFVAARSLVGILWKTLHFSAHTQVEPLVIGLFTLTVFLVLYRYVKSFSFVLALVAGSALAALLDALFGWQVLRIGGFDSSVLRPLWPGASDPEVIEDVRQLMGLALALAFLAALEQSVMAKTLATRTGHHPEVNQDMFSLGGTNIACAFFAGMPASGSITRSALNDTAGARTGLASIFSGLLCLTAAFFLGPHVVHIPKTCLAAVIIGVAITVISIKNLRICLAATKSDALVVVLTFLSALLLPLSLAIFIGVAVSVLLYLKKASRPYLAEYEFNEAGMLAEVPPADRRRIPQISIVHVEGDLFFGAAELFRTQIHRVCQDPNLMVIILRMRNARHLDATSVMALEELILFLRAHERHLIISGATPEVVKVLRNSGLLDVLDDDLPRWHTDQKDRNLFANDPRNPNLSTRDALRRAQAVIGSDTADIRIFYDPQHSSR